LVHRGVVFFAALEILRGQAILRPVEMFKIDRLSPDVAMCMRRDAEDSSLENASLKFTRDKVQRNISLSV